MKKLYLLFIFLVFGASFIFALDPVEGLWKSVDEKSGKVTAVWKISVQGNKLFGEIVVAIGKNPKKLADNCKDSYPGFPKSGKVNQMFLVGTPFIYNLEKKSEGMWHNGYIVAPDTGKYYYCKINFKKADGKKYKEDSLEMRGEIGLGIGRSQIWKKTTEEETESLISNNKW
ncbi:MAG: DUF2147 domain-containing protein [Treponema sp.]